MGISENAIAACQVVRAPASDSRAQALIRLFEQLAREEGWQPGGELRSYLARSTYFAAYASQGTGSAELIGGLQLVGADSSGSSAVLPCQKVWPEIDVLGTATPGRIGHVTMLALAKPWRGATDGNGVPLFWHLGVELWRHCAVLGIETLWLEATPRTLSCYRRLGWPLVVRGPLRQHWGEDCYLTSLDLVTVTKSVSAKATRSQGYRRILGLARGAD